MKKLIGLLLILTLLAALAPLSACSPKSLFKEPLIEAAVRAHLGLSDDAEITEEDLLNVTEFFVLGDQVFSNGNLFYEYFSQVYEDAPDGDITTLEDVEMMPNLMAIYVTQQPNLSDLSPLSSLDKLTDVNFQSTAVADATPLSGMQNLVNVNLTGTPLTDVSCLDACPALQNLEIGYTQITSVAALGGRGSVVELALMGFNAETLDGIEEFVQLRRLRLEDANVADMRALADCPALEEVVTNNGTVDPQTLADMYADSPAIVFNDDVLEGLIRTAMNVPDGDITEAMALAVTSLNLEMEGGAPLARVDDLSALAYFENLTGLNLNWCFNDNDDVPTDISVLSGLTKLDQLQLACCGLTDVNLRSIENLTDMKTLWLFGNDITDISALSGMTDMETLWLGGCPVADVGVLAGMPNLAYLDLSGTGVTDLSPLANLAKLTTLYLSGCPATDYAPLQAVYPNLTDKDFEL